MTTIIFVVIFIAVCLLWLVAWIGLLFYAIDTYEIRDKFIGGIASFLIFAVPIGIVVNAHENNEAIKPLCLQGHEEYQSRSTIVMSGKVVVPINTTIRVWICDRRLE